MATVLTVESREIVEELRHLEEKLHMWREVRVENGGVNTIYWYIWHTIYTN